MSIVLAPSPSAVPGWLHWGADLGEVDDTDLTGLAASLTPGVPHSALDRPRHTGVVPDGTAGFTGTPALQGFRAAGGSTPRLRDWTVEVDDGDDARVTLTGSDSEAGWLVAVHLELTREGLLRSRTTVTNAGDGDLNLAAVLAVLPVGAHATELLDFTGRWCKERTPQRHPWQQGTWSRNGRHGRTGHDASLLMIAGTPGFGFGSGEVWGVHTAWSGDHTTYAERTPEGDCLLGGGELLAPGEIALPPGETYASPWLVGSWSGAGMDPMSHRFHDWLRRHSPRTRTPRPVLVNTWEAAYFEHALEPLTALGSAAAAVGAERFVLDDGWFLGRRDDERGLGDWTVDPAVWPEGLTPLIDAVAEHGLDFGLWVEPEMVNLDSDLARAHPDWVLRGREELPETWRHQQVLDLQVPQAYAHVRDALLALLDEHEIAFLKWDHNRDLIDVAHDGRPAVHGQTLAFYRLLDELRAAHPGLEIESCASGGGRVDLEVLTRTDRIWPSDTIDALERQHLQRWTSLLVPPELIGSHLGGPVAHTTGRSHRLGFRAATALLHHVGIEWNLAELDDLSRLAVRAWVELHQQVRPLLPTGRLVHADHPDPAVHVTGVVDPEQRMGWYVVAALASLDTQLPHPVRLPGLAADTTYRVTCVTPTQDQHGLDLGASWTDRGEIVTRGSALARVGVRLPVLAPETAQVLRVEARDA